MSECAGVVNLGRSDLLQVAEERITTGVGAGEKHAKPTQNRREERIQPAGLCEGDTERSIQSRVTAHVAEPDHAGDCWYRNCHLPRRQSQYCPELAASDPKHRC